MLFNGKADVEVQNVTPATFDITVPVHVSGTFYAWVFQFVGQMRIISPSWLLEAYAKRLHEAADEALT